MTGPGGADRRLDQRCPGRQPGQLDRAGRWCSWASSRSRPRARTLAVARPAGPASHRTPGRLDRRWGHARSGRVTSCERLPARERSRCRSCIRVKKAAATRRLLVSMQLGHAGRRLGLPRALSLSWTQASVAESRRRRLARDEVQASLGARRPALASPRGSEREPLAWPTRSEPRAVATSPAGRRTRASCRCAPWTRPAAAGRGTSRPPSRGRPTTAPAWSTRRSAASVPPG
jgi:hypothetical protein